ncbi:MAG: regulatory protein RecX [Desulfosarcina sp.]|nr:regulatory protein RecX [Desulfobacterales bacterium]
MKHTITDLKWHKSQPNRIMVHVDGQPCVSVSLVAAGRFTVGNRIGADELKQLQAEQGQRDAVQCALRYLATRDRSRLEIRRQLKRKGFEAAVVDLVLKNLVQKKYIDDQVFAANWVNHRMNTSPRSLRLMGQELKHKGIAGDQIEKALSAIDEHKLALACIHRKRRRWLRFKGRERRLKILTHLSNKGFSYDVSRAAVDAYRHHAD